VFPKRKYIFFETKKFLFRKHLRNGSKIILFLLRKHFNCKRFVFQKCSQS